MFSRKQRIRFHLGACLTVALLSCFACSRDSGLQTVVSAEEGRVVVRYVDGTERSVLNDFNYELRPGDEVKVVENCDGKLHVAVLYGS